MEGLSFFAQYYFPGTLHRFSMTIWVINASHAMEHPPCQKKPNTTWMKLDTGDVLSLRRWRQGPELVAVTEKDRWRSLIMEGAIGLDKGGGRVKNDSGLIISCKKVHSWNGAWVTFPAVFFESMFLNIWKWSLFIFNKNALSGKILYYVVNTNCHADWYVWHTKKY